jgi:uncharacterized membrane protein
MALILLQAASPDFLIFLGRFHPLMVHLPIGFLFIVVALEYLSRRKKYENLRHATTVVLFFTSVTSILAALLGYFLSLGGDYDENILFWHKWFGIAMAAGSTIALIFRVQFEKKPSRLFSNIYIFFLIISFLLLIGTGHQGGSLTHGSDYLFSYMPEPLRKLSGLPPREKKGFKKIPNIEEAVVYRDIVQPILDLRCTNCHNQTKKKGGLLLTNFKSIVKGGKNGKIVVPGKPMESHLYTYLLLPEGDEKHMPPKGKQQLNKAEIRIIGWWIHENMPLDKTVSQFVLQDSIKMALKKFSEGEKEPTGIFAKKVKAAEPAKLLALRDKGIKAQPIAKGVNYLQVSLAPGKDSFGITEVQALRDITEQLAWLNLNRKKVNPDALSALSLFPNISRLYLANTDVRDQMLKEIARLKNLEYLNIYGTAVTDKGLNDLHSLKELRSLYLWHTQVTPDAAEKLKASMPQLNIYLGENDQLLVKDSLK